MALLHIAEVEFLYGERVAAAVDAHDVECGDMNAELLDGGGWSAEVRAAAGGKVFVIVGAAHGRDDDVQARAVDKAHASAQHEQVKPVALNSNAARSSERGKVGRGIARERDVRGHEAGVGKVNAMVVADFDVAG